VFCFRRKQLIFAPRALAVAPHFKIHPNRDDSELIAWLPVSIELASPAEGCSDALQLIAILVPARTVA
jgi:hypothetical protein